MRMRVREDLGADEPQAGAPVLQAGLQGAGETAARDCSEVPAKDAVCIHRLREEEVRAIQEIAASLLLGEVPGCCDEPDGAGAREDA